MHGSTRIQGITTAILESNQRYMQWPVYIPFEMPYGTNGGTIQIPNAGTMGSVTNGTYAVVSVTLGKLSLTSSSSTIDFGLGVPTPAKLTLS